MDEWTISAIKLLCGWMKNISYQTFIVKPLKFSVVTYCTHSTKKCYPWLLSVDHKLKCSAVVCKKLEMQNSVYTRLTDILKNHKIF